MANPLYNEEELIAEIKKERIKVHPLVWELLNHHIRNDVNLISVALGQLYMLPRWILKVSSWVMKVLHRIVRPRGRDPLDIDVVLEKSLERCKNVGDYLKKVKQLTSGGEND